MTPDSPLYPTFLACSLGGLGAVIMVCHAFTVARLIRKFVSRIFGVEISPRGQVASGVVGEGKAALVWITYWILWWGLFIVVWFFAFGLLVWMTSN